MITTETAHAAVRMLSAAFPSPPLTEDTTNLYVAELTRRPFSDPELLMIAVGEAMHLMDRLPTIHQLRVAYEGAARGKTADEQMALERAGHARTSSPQPDERYGREMIDVLRTALKENVLTGDGTRGHDHHHGADQCPVCSRKDGTAEAVRNRVNQLLTARHIVPGLQPVVTYRCRECQDRGVVEVDGPAGQLTVRPCPHCREDQYAAWSEGKYRLRRGW